MLNTAALTGVCVRHSDDCTPLCVPKLPQPDDRRVCSKGCNQVIRDAVTNTIVVCQLEKRTQCSPPLNNDEGNQETNCKEQKWVEAKAVCDFSNALWRAGATCMITAAHQAQGEGSRVHIYIHEAPSMHVHC